MESTKRDLGSTGCSVVQMQAAPDHTRNADDDLLNAVSVALGFLPVILETSNQGLQGDQGMRWSIVLLAAVAGCDSRSPASESEAGHELVTVSKKRVLNPVSAATLSDYVGRYHLEYSNGDKATVVFDGEGKVEAIFGGQLVTATFSVPAPGKVCFDKVSSGDAYHCWKNGPARQDGSWIATLDDGLTLTVTPVG